MRPLLSEVGSLSQKQKFATALSLKGKENIPSNKKRTRDDVVVAAGSKNISIILTNLTVTSLTIKQYYVMMIRETMTIMKMKTTIMKKNDFCNFMFVNIKISSKLVSNKQ